GEQLVGELWIDKEEPTILVDEQEPLHEALAVCHVLARLKRAQAGLPLLKERVVAAIDPLEIPAASGELAGAGEPVMRSGERLDAALDAEPGYQTADVGLDVVGGDPRAAAQRTVA